MSDLIVIGDVVRFMTSTGPGQGWVVGMYRRWAIVEVSTSPAPRLVDVGSCEVVGHAA